MNPAKEQFLKRLLAWFPVQPAGSLTLLLLGLTAATCFTLESRAAEQKITLSPGEWEFQVDPDDQVFPSLCIATATMKVKHSSLIPIRLSSPADNCKVRAVVTAKGLMEESATEQTVKSAGQTYEINTEILWDFTALARIKQPQPANVTVELFADGKSLGKKTKTVKVRSINDCPFAVVTSKGVMPTPWMFAAYVNEDHPWVDSILKSALASKQADSFTGYQRGNPQEVYRQVFAIWYVMQQAGLKYSSITKTSSQSPKVASQHVRFLDEIVRNTQANCVDGSILFASILRKIDIEPFLVIVPGHCFVGFWMDSKKSNYACLETTMMGSVDLKMVAVAAKGRASHDSFLKAMDAGNKYLAAQKEKHAKTKNMFDLMIVDIDAFRKIGITPIAYQADSAKR